MASDEGQIFVLCVIIKFQNEEDRDEFLQGAWQPLAEWVKDNEEGTLGYEAMIGDLEPLKVQIFERYISRDYFRNVHQTSEPYLAFKAQQAGWRKEHAVEVTGCSFFETGIGHMHRDDVVES